VDPFEKMGLHICSVVFEILELLIEMLSKIVEVKRRGIAGRYIFFVFFRGVDFFNMGHVRFLGICLEMVSVFIRREDVFCIGDVAFRFPCILG
jgi:hypothetical protein